MEGVCALSVQLVPLTSLRASYVGMKQCLRMVTFGTMLFSRSSAAVRMTARSLERGRHDTNMHCGLASLSAEVGDPCLIIRKTSVFMRPSTHHRPLADHVSHEHH
jgi:hypothetical protein